MRAGDSSERRDVQDAQTGGDAAFCGSPCVDDGDERPAEGGVGLARAGGDVDKAGAAAREGCPGVALERVG